MNYTIDYKTLNKKGIYGTSRCSMRDRDRGSDREREGERGRENSYL